MIRKRTLLPALAFGIGLAAAAAVHAEEATIIELSQTACQFVEVEAGGDHGFTSRSKADCEALNARTGVERLASAEVLTLQPGDYVFRVKNENVPYALGFWLRDLGYDDANVLKRLTLTSVSGGGLDTGVTKDYKVTLEPGEYIYSCPLNPTPNYRIVVQG